MKSDKTWFYTHSDLPTPISVTHDDMQKGYHPGKICKKSRATELYLISLSSKDSKKDDNKLIIAPAKSLITSTYRRDYKLQFNPRCLSTITIDTDLDPLFNRRPVNAFEMCPWAPQKFMDDHFFQPSEDRKRINFLRQIRQTSNLNYYFDASSKIR